MGIYWAAFNHVDKEYFEPPINGNSKAPGLYMPGNPFPGMLCMKMFHSEEFELIADTCELYYDCKGYYKNITSETYAMWLDHIGMTDEEFKTMQKEMKHNEM